MASQGKSSSPADDVEDFLRIQTETGWGKTLAQFANWCNPVRGWRILDVGCGPGLLPAIFQQLGCQAFGTDLNFLSLSTGGLHPALALADACQLPFKDGCFNLVTASNLLFMLEEPLLALREMARLITPVGKVCILNPSERLSVSAASEWIDQRGLDGLARASLLNWAARAESHQRWTERQTASIFARAGLSVSTTDLKIGPGFGRFTCGELWKPD